MWWNHACNETVAIQFAHSAPLMSIQKTRSMGNTETIAKQAPLSIKQAMAIKKFDEYK